MATVDMRNADEYFQGFGVGFSSEVVASPTAYVWNASGFDGNVVYLYGTGITSAAGAPASGTITEIRIDLSGDGFLGATEVDITITGISLPLVDLAQDDDLFWETVLENNDTIHVFHGGTDNITFMFGDGVGYAGSVGTIASDDTLDATGTLGNVEMYGDYKTLTDASIIAGDDIFTCDTATGGVGAVGDVDEIRSVSADVSVLAGDDLIDITSLAGAVIKYFVGDVKTIDPSGSFDANVTGGDDTITNHSGGQVTYIAGDVFDQLGGTSGFVNTFGGDDNITGSGVDENIAGDVYNLAAGEVHGGDDLIIAGGGDDNIAGEVLFETGGTVFGGDDVIDGGLGDDTIDGQGGVDWAQFASDPTGVVVILGSGGTDGSAEGQGGDILRGIENVLSSESDDTITGNVAANVVFAMDGDDSVNGAGGADSLFGLDGADTLVGGAGADTLEGGNDDDTLTGGSGDDEVNGGAGSDWIDFSSYGSGVTGGLASGLFTAASSDAVSDIENVIGSRHADDLSGDEVANSVKGGRGNDILRGRQGGDNLTGGGDDDTVHGGSGNDTVKGGDGDDLLNGENNSDVIESGGGNNTVNGGSGNDTITGGDDDDALNGDGNNDVLTGGTGDDTLDGGTGSDWADYSAATTAVTVDLSITTAQDTGEGLDTLISVENVTGSAFADTLLGTDGDNQFTGGLGADTITGLLGADVFTYATSADTGLTIPERDVINGFEHLADIIDVSALDAQTSVEGIQDFVFIGTDDFSAEGQIRAFQAGADTFLRFNATGTDDYESAILLKNTTAADLTVDDFLT